MKLDFTKMQACGNDFVVVDAVKHDINLNVEQLQKIADRHKGIGCDQVLKISPGQNGADFHYQIFNADGQEVGQCGNGARCIGLYIRQQQLSTKSDINLSTISQPLAITIHSTQDIEADLGPLSYDPISGPLLLNKDASIELTTLDLGNPHAVIITDDIEQAPLQSIGQTIMQHPRFPDGINVGFMQIQDPHHIQLRVLERGCGETLACGSGACAAAITGLFQDMLQNPVTVQQTGGSVQVTWTGIEDAVKLRGNAQLVFSGTIEL